MAEYKDMTRYRELFDEEYKKIRELISQGETHLDNLAEGFTGADMVIRKMPAADVVEVRRGKWVSASNKPGTNIGMKCSLCGARIKYSEFFNGNHNFCHKCGADMRGKTNDNRTEN